MTLPGSNADDSKAGMARLRSTVLSATTVVPSLLSLLPGTRSALEVGCGSAAWLTMLERHGVAEILGLDRARHPRLHIADADFRQLDPGQPFNLGRRFDLTLCLNLAEHLPSARAPGLVADLCATSEVVVFCAAVPGEGDVPHARWPSYWARLFAAQGHACLDCLRPLIWADSRVDWRYAQSLLCFVQEKRLAMLPHLAAAARVPGQMLDLVHPRAEMTHPLPR